MTSRDSALFHEHEYRTATRRYFNGLLTSAAPIVFAGCAKSSCNSSLSPNTYFQKHVFRLAKNTCKVRLNITHAVCECGNFSYTTLNTLIQVAVKTAWASCANGQIISQILLPIQIFVAEHAVQKYRYMWIDCSALLHVQAHTYLQFNDLKSISFFALEE